MTASALERHEERVRFCVEHALGALDEGLVRLILERLSGPHRVFDRREGWNRLVAALVEQASNASDAADLALLGITAHDESLGNLLGGVVDEALAIAARGPRSRLHVALRPSLAQLSPVLQARGFLEAYRSYEMATREVHVPGRPAELPPGWSWRAPRDVAAETLDEVRAMVERAFLDIPGAHIPEPEVYRAQLLASGGNTGLLFEGPAPRGLFRVRMVGDCGYVALIARDPSAQGRGLGPVLLAAAMRRLVSLGARHLALEVVAENARALRLYERHGFETRGFETTWSRVLR